VTAPPVLEADCISRYGVLTDREWHDVELRGEIIHVEMRTPYIVEFWACRRAEESPRVRRFRAFTDDEPIVAEAGMLHLRGSTTCLNGTRAWHLIEVTLP
jgi:hypothetical protein